MKHYAKNALSDSLVKYGFEQDRDLLYNEDLDLEVEICFRNKYKLEWV